MGFFFAATFLLAMFFLSKSSSFLSVNKSFKVLLDSDLGIVGEGLIGKGPQQEPSGEFSSPVRLIVSLIKSLYYTIDGLLELQLKLILRPKQNQKI